MKFCKSSSAKKSEMTANNAGTSWKCVGALVGEVDAELMVPAVVSLFAVL